MLFTDAVLTVPFLLLSISEGNSVSQILCTVSSLILTCIWGGEFPFFFSHFCKYPNNFEHQSTESHIIENLLYTSTIRIVPETRESIE